MEKQKNISGFQLTWRLFIFHILDGYYSEWSKFVSKCKRNFIKIDTKNRLFWSHIQDNDKFIIDNLPNGISVHVVEITDRQFGMSKVYYGKKNK